MWKCPCHVFSSPPLPPLIYTRSPSILLCRQSDHHSTHAPFVSIFAVGVSPLPQTSHIIFLRSLPCSYRMLFVPKSHPTNGRCQTEHSAIITASWQGRIRSSMLYAFKIWSRCGHAYVISRQEVTDCNLTSGLEDIIVAGRLRV